MLKLQRSWVFALAVLVTIFGADGRASDFAAPVAWKVGDHLGYQITLGILGKLGTLSKDVFKEEGTAVWLRQSTALTGKSDVQEMLVDRATGNVIRYLKNGQEATYSDEQIEVKAQDTASVTVPAGTFQGLHVSGTVPGGGSIETWSAPDALPIDGVIKTLLDGTTAIELTDSQRGR